MHGSYFNKKYRVLLTRLMLTVCSSVESVFCNALLSYHYADEFCGSDGYLKVLLDHLDKPYSDCLVNLRDQEHVDAYQEIHGTNYSMRVMSTQNYSSYRVNYSQNLTAWYEMLSFVAENLGH